MLGLRPLRPIQPGLRGKKEGHRPLYLQLPAGRHGVRDGSVHGHAFDSSALPAPPPLVLSMYALESPVLSVALDTFSQVQGVDALSELITRESSRALCSYYYLIDVDHVTLSATFTPLSF